MGDVEGLMSLLQQLQTARCHFQADPTSSLAAHAAADAYVAVYEALPGRMAAVAPAASAAAAPTDTADALPDGCVPTHDAATQPSVSGDSEASLSKPAMLMLLLLCMLATLTLPHVGVDLNLTLTVHGLQGGLVHPQA